jgi:hypothetical protein
VDAGDEKLEFHSVRLMEAIAALRAAGSLHLLRLELKRLRSAALDPASPLRAAAAGESVTYSHDFFLDELKQIGESRTLERACYYVDRFARGVTEVRTLPINDINLNRWKEYDDIQTDSLWLVDRRDRSGVHRAEYWGNFIPQIPNQMMRRYTRRGDWVLDPFAGSGTTAIEARRLGRNCLGLELRRDVVHRARALVSAEPNPYGARASLLEGDATRVDYEKLLAKLGARSVQLVVLHPPYHDIIRFSDHPRDLSNAASVEAFLSGLREAAERAVAVLDRGRYLALVVGDKYARGRWVPLGFKAMETLQDLGLSLKSIVVKNFDGTAGKRSQRELWKYRALVGGFYVFKHEYVFVMVNE